MVTELCARTLDRFVSPAWCLALLLAAWVPLFAAPSPIRLQYQLNPQVEEGRLVLHLRLAMEGLTGTETELVVPSSWGNSIGLTRAVRNLKADTASFQIVDTDDPAKKILRGTGRRASISYDLVKDWEGGLRESVRHRVHLEPNYLEINTSNALVHPNLDQAAAVDCIFDWELPPQWTLATSFGTDPTRQRFRGSWDTVENALFVAGDFRIHRLRMGKGWLTTAVRGKWSISDDEAISQIVRVIRLERTFWKDDNFPYYLVTLVPFDPGQSGSGGSGFSNAFSIHTSPGEPFSSGLLSLLAHEIFHTWNPYKLGRMRSPAERIYWFTEGFTTYYQDLLLWRSGLLPVDAYIAALNRILRDYHFSPAKNISLRELVARAREDNVKGRISYERGAATALWLDSTIRNRTQSKSSLDSLMFDLFREARRERSRFPDLTPDRVLQAASRYIDTEEIRQLRAYVESGSTIEAPADAFGPCVTRVMVDMPSFELGMDRTGLIEKHLVTDIKPGSEAEKSGLKEGDSVIGTSVYWNDTSKPVKLTIRRGATTSAFEYYPRGTSIGIVPQYAANIDRFRADPQSCRATGAIY